VASLAASAAIAAVVVAVDTASRHVRPSPGRATPARSTGNGRPTPARSGAPQLNTISDIPQEARTLIALYFAGIIPADRIDQLAVATACPLRSCWTMFTAVPKWQNLPTLPVRNRI
jgi:hypothetical protein